MENHKNKTKQKLILLKGFRFTKMHLHVNLWQQEQKFGQAFLQMPIGFAEERFLYIKFAISFGQYSESFNPSDHQHEGKTKTSINRQKY